MPPEPVPEPGILAVWTDCAEDGLEHFERWYNREHLLERVDVPGFRWGRRYEAVSGGDRRFMACYEVDSPDVLNSPAYLQRLENPTPWTNQALRSFRGMVRTVCDLRLAAGRLAGSHAVVLRADDAMAPQTDAGGFVETLAMEDGIARVQLWTASARQTKADTTEMKSRGGDQVIAGALVVECIRRTDADRIADKLATPPEPLGITGRSVLGTYQLLCAYHAKR